MESFQDVANYVAWYQTERGQLIDQLQQTCLWALYQPVSGTMVIDIGCGPGQYSRHLVDQGVRVVGVDASRAMIEHARSQDDHALYRQMDMHELDYDDDLFDGAISTFAIEFSSDPSLMIQEARRVVKPGGDIVIGFIQKGSAYADEYIEKGKQGHLIYSQATFYSVEDICAHYPEEVVAVSDCLYFGPNDPVTDQKPENITPGVVFVHWRKAID